LELLVDGHYEDAVAPGAPGREQWWAIRLHQPAPVARAIRGKRRCLRRVAESERCSFSCRKRAICSIVAGANRLVQGDRNGILCARNSASSFLQTRPHSGFSYQHADVGAGMAWRVFRCAALPTRPRRQRPRYHKKHGPDWLSSIGFSTGSVVVPGNRNDRYICFVIEFSKLDLPTFLRPKSRCANGIPWMCALHVPPFCLNKNVALAREPD